MSGPKNLSELFETLKGLIHTTRRAWRNFIDGFGGPTGGPDK